MEIRLNIDKWLDSLLPSERLELMQRLACESDFLLGITDQLISGMTENLSSTDSGTINEARLRIVKHLDPIAGELMQSQAYELQRLNARWQNTEPPEGKRLLFRTPYGVWIGRRVNKGIVDDAGEPIYAPDYWMEIP